jgi:hypothetical protein
MIHSHKHLNPGESCATCLIEARENGMDNKKWLMGAGALVVVGGAIGYYLHTKNKGATSTQKVTPAVTLKLDGEMAEKLGLSFSSAFAQAIERLAILGVKGIYFKFGPIDVYQYEPYASLKLTNRITEDSIGPFGVLAFANTAIPALPLVPRLGIATDLIDKRVGTDLASLAGLNSGPALAFDRAKNKEIIKNCLGLASGAKSFYVRLNEMPSILNATIKVLISLINRANAYWEFRAAANPLANDPKKSLDFLDFQRIIAAALWSLVQSDSRGDEFAGYMTKLELVGRRLGLETSYLYADVTPNSPLRKNERYSQMMAYIQAFSDGIFNCENPMTDNFAFASASLNAALEPGSVESMLASSTPIKNAQMLAGIVFYQSYNF